MGGSKWLEPEPIDGPYSIVFDKGCFMVRYSESITSLLIDEHNFIEVIGNIHQHPKLAKKLK